MPRSFPDLEPLYTAARSYLEISQRIDLLNARVDVSRRVVSNQTNHAEALLPLGTTRYAKTA
jgi:uncharacterized Rmd1/YagE family protein